MRVNLDISRAPVSAKAEQTPTANKQRVSAERAFILVTRSLSCTITMENQSVFIDKDGVPHYDGDPQYAEEWEERVLLGFLACSSKEGKATFCGKNQERTSWTGLDFDAQE